MLVIPVLDLLDGRVVRAVRGERDHYRPIASRLCATSDPLDVAHALIAATGSPILYVADLGAILQQREHAHALAALCSSLDAAHPGTTLWLDAGYRDYDAMRATLDRIEHLRPRTPRTPHATAIAPVFGTESLRDAAALRAAVADGLDPVLSLDYRRGSLLSAAGFSGADPASTDWWPARIIAMTLDHVGSYDGPDCSTIAALRERAANRMLIGAGGVRDRADLADAAASGADAWLVASALHDGLVGVIA